MNIIKHYSRLL